MDVGGAALLGGGEQRRACASTSGSVDVDHAGGRHDRLRDLVHVVRGRQPGADVEELPDARLPGQVDDGAAKECPVSRAPMRPEGMLASDFSATSRSAAK